MSCAGEKITFYFYLNLKISLTKCKNHGFIDVLYPEKGVCADPVDKGAILGEGGGSSPAVTKGVS